MREIDNSFTYIDSQNGVRKMKNRNKTQNQNTIETRIPINPIVRMPINPMVRMFGNTLNLFENFTTFKNTETKWNIIGYSKDISKTK